jgi:hypothetical protein
VAGNDHTREVQIHSIGCKNRKVVNTSGDVTERFWPATREFAEASVFQIPHGKPPRDEVLRYCVKLIAAVRHSPEATV